MVAAERGSLESVQALLEAGAPWHAQDAEGYCAGDYASGSKNRAVLQQLLDWAVRAELILGTPHCAAAAPGRHAHSTCKCLLLVLAGRVGTLLSSLLFHGAGTISRREKKGAAPNRDYLSSSIRYEDGKLMDEQGGLQQRRIQAAVNMSRTGQQGA